MPRATEEELGRPVSKKKFVRGFRTTTLVIKKQSVKGSVGPRGMLTTA